MIFEQCHLALAHHFGLLTRNEWTFKWGYHTTTYHATCLLGISVLSIPLGFRITSGPCISLVGGDGRLSNFPSFGTDMDHSDAASIPFHVKTNGHD